MNAAAFRKFGLPVVIVRANGERNENVVGISADESVIEQIVDVPMLGVRRTVIVPAEAAPDEEGLVVELEGVAYEVKSGGRLSTNDHGKTVLLLLQEIAG